MTTRTNASMSFEEAQAIALQAFTYLMRDDQQASRFLSETGYSAADVGQHVDSPELQLAALTVLVEDESALLTFAANAAMTPETVMHAYMVLSHGPSGRPPMTSI